MKRDILFNVSKSDDCVDYPHFEQIWTHFMASQCMHFIYFSRIREGGKQLFLLWSKDKGEDDRHEVDSKTRWGGFRTTADVDSEPQQRWVLVQGQGGFWNVVE